jgi:cyclopropane fatty-acyl-phospholipid synthase-like methyltransferase
VTNTQRAYFEKMYESDPDPWGFATSWYERRKYALTVAALPLEHYKSAFEPGCSIGVLTSLLAPRCKKLLASELIGSVAEDARKRLKEFPHVRVELGAIPEYWPNEKFDLVVLSELAYYFDSETLARVVELLMSSIVVHGTLVGVHWRGVTDYPLSGDAAHEIIGRHPRMRSLVHHEEPELVLDVWSVAK